MDGVFRDPWGKPYIISLDLDSSGTTSDGFYRGLIEEKVQKNGYPDYPSEIAAPAVVWSLGPDGRLDSTLAGLDDETKKRGPKAILQFGDNSDNILSWDK